MDTVTAEKSRVFFALWPSPAMQEQLSALAQRLQKRTGGRALTAEHLHLTLVFIGEVLPPQIDALLECADSMPALEAQLVLDQVGFWARTGVVWVGSRDPDPRLIDFTGDLHRRLQRLGFRLQDRAFRPHITLLRRARRRARSDPIRLVWPLSEFALTSSVLQPAGAKYSVLRRWSSAGDME